jgi:hypothetical protein
MWSFFWIIVFLVGWTLVLLVASKLFARAVRKKSESSGRDW